MGCHVKVYLYSADLENKNGHPILWVVDASVYKRETLRYGGLHMALPLFSHLDNFRSWDHSVYCAPLTSVLKRSWSSLTYYVAYWNLPFFFKEMCSTLSVKKTPRNMFQLVTELLLTFAQRENSYQYSRDHLLSTKCYLSYVHKTLTNLWLYIFFLKDSMLRAICLKTLLIM